MDDKQFLCALDLPDRQFLDRRSSFRIVGWIIPSEDVGVDEIRVEFDGRPHRASYPLTRPDVAEYYPGVARAALSGFATAPVALDESRDTRVEVKVLARSGNAWHVAHRRPVEIVWFDCARELFPLSQVGPFKYPADFDPSRVASYPRCRPTFFLGPEAPLEARPGDAFVEMLRALVECHDVFFDWRNQHWVHLGPDSGRYAAGRLDPYGILDDIVAAYHRAAGVESGGACAYQLAGKEGLLAVPLLSLIYPHARFVYAEASLGRRVGDRMRALWQSSAGRLARGHAAGSRYAAATLGRSDRDILALLRARDPNLRVETVEPRSLGELATRDWPKAAPAPAAPDGSDDFLRCIPSNEDARPVFVLGAGRSGTSAMVGALRAAGFQGFHEGHVFPMLDAMARGVWRTMSTGEGESVRPAPTRADVVAAIVSRVVGQAYGGHDGRAWLDKTPDHAMIDCVPLVAAVFPQARFVMMRRHPIAFAESRLRKFGQSPLSAIVEWVKCLESWKSNREAIPSAHRLECDANALRERGTQDAVVELLGLDAAQRKAVGDYLSAERPELTRAGADLLAPTPDLSDARAFNLRSIFYEMMDALGEYIEDMHWSAEQQQAVVRAMGPLPAEFGYEVTRPSGHLVKLIAGWARTIEQYRYTAEFHENNAAYWSGRAEELAAQNKRGTASGG